MGPLLLILAALWGVAAHETLFGVLGSATLLRVPHELHRLARGSRESSWKRSTEEPQRREFLLRVSGGNVTEFEPGRMRFHHGDFSLEILNTSREDARLYEFSVSRGRQEEAWQLWLEVFEAVAVPSIRVLGREVSNGSCRLSLRCSSERGDRVSYSWAGGDNGTATAGICSGHGALLNLSLPARAGPFGCVCTAANPVGSRKTALDSGLCGSRHRGDPGVRMELLVLPVALGVIVVIVVIVTFRATRSAKGDQDPSLVTVDPSQVTSDPSPVTPDSAGHTIYTQVQRVQKPKGTVPKATTPGCSTIYSAATGPPPAPGRAPWSPAESPRPRGHLPLSQVRGLSPNPAPGAPPGPATALTPARVHPEEPTTVYASVTLPVA